MSSFEKICGDIRTHLQATAAPSATVMTADQVFQKTIEFIHDENYTNAPSTASLENLAETPRLSGGTDLSDTNALSSIIDFVNGALPEGEFSMESGVGSRAHVVETVAKNVARIVSGGTLSAAEQVGEGRVDPENKDLGALMGGAASADIYMDAQRSIATMESFGAGLDNINNDVRINVALSIMRAFKSLPDRMIARVADPDAIVKINIPEHEVYDLARSRAATAAERYGNHRHPMIDMFRNPSPIDTTPKKVLLPKGTDDDILADNYVKPDRRINIFDKTHSSTAVGYDHRSYTDILSEGGRIVNLTISVTGSAGTAATGDDTTESFIVPVGFLKGARFVQYPNSAGSTKRTALIEAKNVFAIRKTTMTSAAATQTLVGSSVESTHAIRISVNLTAELDIQEGDLHLSGSATMAVTDDDGNAPTAAQTNATALNTAVTTHAAAVSITGYETEIYFSEENVRKASTAVRQRSIPYQFEIPVGRTFVVDVSLQQPEPAEVLDVISTVNDLGNTSRALRIMESTLSDVQSRIAYEEPGNVPPAERISRQFPGGSLVLPYVVNQGVDFATANLKLMRESEISSDVHSKMTRTLLGVVAEVLSRSLYHTNLGGGEMVAFKLVAHNDVVNTVFAIPQYHEELQDAPEGGRMQRNSSYSIRLHNNARVDVYGVDFDSWKDKAIMFPVRDAKPADITSFATTRDRGTFVGAYTNSDGGQASKRFVVSSREITFPQSPAGASLSIANIADAYPNLG